MKMAFMYVIVEDFYTWAVMLSEIFWDWTGKKRISWIVVPARFCCEQFNNDSRYLHENKSTEIRNCMRLRKKKPIFMRITFPTSRPK